MYAPRTGVPVSASTTLPTAPGACVYVQVQPPVRKHMRNKSSLERLSEVIIGTAQHFHHFLVGRLWEAVIITPYRVELGINKEHQHPVRDPFQAFDRVVRCDRRGHDDSRSVAVFRRAHGGFGGCARSQTVVDDQRAFTLERRPAGAKKSGPIFGQPLRFLREYFPYISLRDAGPV